MDYNNIRQELNPSSSQNINSISSSTYDSYSSKSKSSIHQLVLQNMNEQNQINQNYLTADSDQSQQDLSSLSEIFKKQEHQLGDTNFKFIKYNPQMTLYSVIISTVFTLGVFAYMILFRVQMFNFSLEFIERMQENRNFFITSFMNFISLCVSPKPVISLLVIFFALSTQKLKILTFLLYYGFLVYTCVTLKSSFGDPRPYWIESSQNISITKNQQNIQYSQQENKINQNYQNLTSNDVNQVYQNYKHVKEIKQVMDKKELDNSEEIIKQEQQSFLEKEINQDNQNKQWISQNRNSEYQNEDLSKQQLANTYDHSILSLDWKCYQEYGNPSGHAFLGIPLLFAQKTRLKPKLFRILVVIGAVILINLILLSRMYLGMHSLNQVIFGGVLGIYATVFYRLVCERRISQMLYKYVQIQRRNAFKQIFQVILLTLVIFSLPIVLYSIQTYIEDNSSITQSQTKQWEKVIQQKCGQFDPMQSFHHKCFIDSSVVAICFSIILGFLLTSREQFLKGQYKEALGLKNFLLRLVIIFSCCSTIAIFYYVIPNANNPYIKYLNLFLGVFITGFLLVTLVPKLLEKYQLIFIVYPLLQDSNQYILNKQFPLSESINPQQFIQSSQHRLQLTL